MGRLENLGSRLDNILGNAQKAAGDTVGRVAEKADDILGGVTDKVTSVADQTKKKVGKWVLESAEETVADAYNMSVEELRMRLKASKTKSASQKSTSKR